MSTTFTTTRTAALRQFVVVANAASILACTSARDPEETGESDSTSADASTSFADGSESDSAPDSSDGGSGEDAGTTDGGDDPTVVETACGLVGGENLGPVITFKGIPYAAPPVGDLRFSAPEPPSCWDGTLSATSFGAECPQIREGGVVGAEDCLSLNVWTPSTRGDRPVMVWFHGGGNQAGSSGEPIYDGAKLAETADVVVVSINYRLGALGFLALPELAQEASYGASGNYGILDQIAALEWVRDNIASFGGDVENVTIFGQSAGAQDVWIHIVSPLSTGLFHAASAHSGLGLALPAGEVEAFGSVVAEAVGCPDDGRRLACLRGATMADVTGAIPGSGGVGQPKIYVPNVDGYVLSDSVFELISSGLHNEVPVVLGTTTDETFFDFGPVDTAEDVSALAHAFYDEVYGAERVDQALSLYPVSSFSTPREALVRLTTDQRFICPTRTYARTLATVQGAPVYRYAFSHDSTMLLSGQGLDELLPFGAFHLWDIQFLFGNFAFSFDYQPEQAERLLSDTMMTLWGSFAAQGQPTLPGGVSWPTYSPPGGQSGGRYLDLDLEPAVAEDDGLAHNCEFWDQG